MLAILLALLALGAPHSPGRIVANDNRTSAGTLRDGVLTIRLEARLGEWHPDRETDPGLTIRAFAEEGKPLQIPGPLIRVARGTEIHAFVRNTLDSALVVHGLSERGVAGPDTAQIPAGHVREFRFRAGAPGTYYYWASTGANAAIGTRRMDSQLTGAFVVDPSALGMARDRIFVIGLWTMNPAPGIVAVSDLQRFVINGKAWPNTERLTYTIGDTVHFRIVNTSAAVHPMHLHGFYFTVDSRGNGRVDSVYAGGSPRFAVTERVAPGRTATITWAPERAGNWLFHCHDNFHVLRNHPLDGTPLPAEHLVHVTNHTMEMMGGLVLGIEVLPGTAKAAAPNDAPRRRLRLLVRVDSGGTEAEPSYGYVLEDGKATSPTGAPLLPGPTIRLRRGEPVSITVVNELPEATTVHWHGIELESYYDGVADYSGARGRIAPAIAPRDSFVARFTPPRAGTFMYHPHADEVRQQVAGLAGALVVADTAEPYDAEHDLMMLVSTPRRAADAGVVLLNGTSTPPPREMRVGERYRIRLVDIHAFRPSMVARLTRDSSTVTWRAIAKDGRDLPPDQATTRPAVQQAGNGETYDFEFTPNAPGDLRFTMSSAVGVLLVSQVIHVR